MTTPRIRKAFFVIVTLLALGGSVFAVRSTSAGGASGFAGTSFAGVWESFFVAPSAPQVTEPTVSTDKTGYLAGETVTVTGAGFAASESLTLQVKHAGGAAEPGMGHEAHSVTTGADGGFTATWSVKAQDVVGHDYVVTVSGASGAPVSAAFSRIAAVQTDKNDYQPGETVAITGAGFLPDEAVEVRIAHLSGRGGEHNHPPFPARNDPGGQIAAEWFVGPEELDSIFVITATGQTSGLRALNVFTDALVTVIDDAGADDEPGQKDLNQLATDNAGLPNTLAVTWNWDDTGWTGNNTGDGCGLFDTDGDGNANYALCVTVKGTPPVQQSTRLFSCGDGRPDRCTQPATPLNGFATTCNTAVGAVGSDPFAALPTHQTNNACDVNTACESRDTIAACSVQMSDMGTPASVSLLNVCSYPSGEPNSDPSECVVTPDMGTIELRKVWEGDAGDVTLRIGTSAGGSQVASTFLDNTNGTTGQKLVDVATYYVSEVVSPAGNYLTPQLSCFDDMDDDGTKGPDEPSVTVGANNSVPVDSGETVVCTFTNTENLEVTRGRIKVVKQTVPAGDSQSFTFSPTNFNGDGTFPLTGVSPANEFTSGLLVTTANGGGPYTVSETVPAGWDLTSATCSNGNDPTQGITVTAGQTVTCTFTNTKRGHLVVQKTTLPAGDTTSFTINASGTGTITGGGAGSVTDATDKDYEVTPGTYSVAETVPTGWDKTGDTCQDVVVAAGETKYCLLTNVKRGHLIVQKTTSPANDTTQFTINASGSGTITGGGAGTVTDATDKDYEVTPGTYSVAETVPAGWDKTGDTCQDVAVAAGETKYCLLTNTKRGHLIVQKTTNPANDLTSFTINASGSGTITGGGAGSVTDATDQDYEVTPGTYSVAETVPAGWDKTGDTCQDVAVAAGETKYCLLTNTKRGRIVVDKVTSPAGDPQSFNFDAGGGSYADFSLTDAALPNDQGLVPGTYSVSETVPAGWDQTSATCDGGNTPQSITLGAGQTVTCTFTNTKRGHLIVQKTTLPAADTTSFTISASGSGTITGGGGGSVTDANDKDYEVTPGTYSVAETVPAGWDKTGDTCQNVAVAAGETKYCLLTNTKRGHLIVTKATLPNTDTTTQFGITAGTTNGTIFGAVSRVLTGNGSSADFEVTPGTYRVGEPVIPSGWDQTGNTCMGVTVAAGETKYCTITNTQRGMVEVKKITNGGVHPELDIRFTLYRDGADADPDLTGTDVQLEELTTLGDADGVLQFTTKLVPGTTYTVCENPVPAGWTSLWTIGFSVGGNIVTPYNPNANDDQPQDLGIRCFDFTVNPAQTKQFEVHNDFPGGDPRTIGYWKNWNQCTGGGQAANAAKNGGPGAGFFILENVLPQLIGDFNVTTCQQGIKVLGKQDQLGKSKSSDAAYELAAQLLAAKDNLAAGAETCTAVQTAVVNGQNLLDQINFTGSGDYLGSKVKGAQLTHRNNALTLANTLDRYNNGVLCP